MNELLKDARKGFKFFDRKLKKIDTEEHAKWTKIKEQLSKVQKKMEKISAKDEAELATWHLFEAAVLEDRKEQLSSLINPWMNYWSLRSSPLILEALMMGFDIGRGFTEEEAYIFHQNWLDEEEDNRIYGDFYFTPEGKVVQITARREHLMSIN